MFSQGRWSGADVAFCVYLRRKTRSKEDLVRMRRVSWHTTAEPARSFRRDLPSCTRRYIYLVAVCQASHSCHKKTQTSVGQGVSLAGTHGLIYVPAYHPSSAIYFISSLDDGISSLFAWYAAPELREMTCVVRVGIDVPWRLRRRRSRQRPMRVA